MAAAAFRALALLACILCAQAAQVTDEQPPRKLTHKEVAKKKAKVDALNKKFEDLDKLKKKINYGKKPMEAPKHVVANATRSVEAWFKSTHFVQKGSCGQKFPLSKRGLKTSVLQVGQHPGQDSFSLPGAGVDQTGKDSGRSATGKIVGAPTRADGVMLPGGEPYVTVLKDGFAGVGCVLDVMLESFDKYSNNKDKYKGEPGNVSIVVYKEHVLEEDMKPMTPVVCFEFCRTVPNMVYFGISNGRDCYCTPYYKKAPSDAKQCDTPCEGDPTQMCGNQAKSSIWEMHLCANTAEVLKENMIKAKVALDFFFEDAVMANIIGSQMTRSGIALEKIGGLSGGPGAGDNGMAAKVAAAELSHAYEKGWKTYQELLKAYTDATSVKSANFADPADASLAEGSIRVMKASTFPVMEAASEMHDLIKLAYPPVDTATFGDDPDPTDPVAVKLAEAGSHAGDDPLTAVEGFDFRAASYSWDTQFTSDSSSCVGPVIGKPIVGLGIKECAKVCEATAFPKTCVAFSFYTIYEDEQVDGKGLSDLCFMLEDIKTLETFQCPDSLAQVGALRGAHNATVAKKGTAYGEFECFVKMSQVSTGYKPGNTAEWKKYNRCVKSTEDKAVQVPDAFQAFMMPKITQLVTDGKDTIAAPP